MVLRRDLLTALAFALPVGACARASTGCLPGGATEWTDWEVFRRALVSDDGRVIDPIAKDVTTSEGQSYAMFFALVAGQQAVFDRLLRWTEDNLCAGDIASRLPAWQWGRRDDGRWDVIDPNAASDADLWIAYTLAQAGRLWKNRRYEALSQVLGRRILADEVVDLAGLGPTLLPGPKGFRLDEDSHRLNPSYLAPPLLAWFAANRPEPAWKGLRASSLQVLAGSAPRGLAPEWTVHVRDRGFVPERLAVEDRVGSYNAIRVYLWLGLTHPDDPALPGLLRQYAPMARLAGQRGAVPEVVDPASGEALSTSGDGPSGFQSALQPMLALMGERDIADKLKARITARPIQARHYYDQVLHLFASGFVSGRYRFTANGSLQTGWAPCDA
ncbi:cellulose synthase complex periplasmic endoglucanase BcsZ [Leptothrix discophora]|uniref:cellulase n=1 Tax=Leptothrix discophora TaxID=89 RepID=A0ABT9G169_LEPDI|nr:cellulose synthase complex periplasmic endoglucanase BcsZ [Leptothrix discophora]MDP4300238.1 cellulose synthase complex periplasmic endoglucanase BcsZ [Leptothrix discophora]